MFAHGEARVQSMNAPKFLPWAEMNQSTTNLEMPTVGDICPRMSTNNNYLSFVTIKFELVGTHPSPDMLDTLPICLTRIPKSAGGAELESSVLSENL